MSDPDTPERDGSSGKFVKRATQKAHDLNTHDDSGVHPLSKILFGWVEAKSTGSLIFWGTALLATALVAMDVVLAMTGHPRHDYFHFAEATGFYGLWGFFAFAFVVLMGWPLGKLLRRGENYYGDAGGPPQDIDPDIGGQE